MSAWAGLQEGTEDWVLYAASPGEEETGATLKEWYRLNRIKPAPDSAAAVRHYYDRNSLAAGTPFSGGIVRVWEKAVMPGIDRNYFEVKQDIERQEEQRLGRKLTGLDQAWIFPLAVKRATRETRILFEINCDSGEFVILEVDHYDKDGNNMSHESNMDRGTWHAVEPGTVMEALLKRSCR
jgi:hypothetical protein